MATGNLVNKLICWQRTSGVFYTRSRVAAAILGGHRGRNGLGGFGDAVEGSDAKVLFLLDGTMTVPILSD